MQAHTRVYTETHKQGNTHTEAQTHEHSMPNWLPKSQWRISGAMLFCLLGHWRLRLYIQKVTPQDFLSCYYRICKYSWRLLNRFSSALVSNVTTYFMVEFPVCSPPTVLRGWQEIIHLRRGTAQIMTSRAAKDFAANCVTFFLLSLEHSSHPSSQYSLLNTNS
jgi:hypothetical protein